MFRRILPPIEDVRAAGVGVIWRRPSFNDTKTTLKKVCEMCHTNGSSMSKCSGCNCTYYCSKQCQKRAWKYHKFVCKNLNIDGWFDRDIYTNIKYAIDWNVNLDCFKDSVVCTSGCKNWKVNFDPDDKDNTYMTLTQSSKEQFLDECNSLDECLTENEDMVTIIFYYIVKTKMYSMAVARV